MAFVLDCFFRFFSVFVLIFNYELTTAGCLQILGESKETQINVLSEVTASNDSSLAATGKILRRDQLRVDQLRSRRQLRGPLKQLIKVPESVSTSIRLSPSYDVEHVVTIGHGTPTEGRMVIVDTGSDLCWIQCEPCINCFYQDGPIFVPPLSPSYMSMPCNSNDCDQLQQSFDSNGCSSNSICSYKYGYADGSYTSGVFSYETISLSPEVKVKNFIMGCSHDSNGSWFDGIDGILGLGRGKLSLINQTYDIYKGIFSYCLPRPSNLTGFLTLGRSDEHRGFSSTPMRTRPDDPSSYYVDLLGISVDRQQLEIPPLVFSLAGTILDSGMTVSYLPKTAYTALRSAFRSRMRKYPLVLPNSDSDLDTCFDFGGFGNITLPTIELHFENNTNVMLHESGILWNDCLAFVGNKDDREVGIIGNVQQRTFEVSYDIGKEIIRFRPAAC